VDKLKKRFSSNQVIISSHFTALTKIQPSKNFDTDGLRRLLDESENRLMGLQVRGISSAPYSSMITPLLLERVPPRWLSSSVKDLFDFIRLEVESEERSKLLQQGVKRVVDPDWEMKDMKKVKTMPSAAALFSSPSTSQRDDGRRCVYCQEHYSETRYHVPLNKKNDRLIKREEMLYLFKERSSSPKLSECSSRMSRVSREASHFYLA